jgi:hypothetical protein
VASQFDMPVSYVPGAFIRTGMDFAELAAAPEVARQWYLPSALEGMSVGAVAAHGLGVLSDILNHCERPEPATPRFLGIVEYYRAARLDKREDLELEGHAYIRADAERNAGEGPGPVLDRARRTLEHLRWVLPAQDPDKHVYLPRQPPMAGPLRMMVANRTLELVAHMDDLAVSVGLPTPPISPEAASMALSVLVSVARRMNTDLELIRAMARVERARPDAARAL